MILLICGLSGAGKSALAGALAPRINAVVLNGDAVREDLSSDLSFSAADRVEQARRIGAVARLLSEQGLIVVADFICPTDETRCAFAPYDFLIHVDRVESCGFEDTNRLWETPDADVVIPAGLTVADEVDLVIRQLGLRDWSAPTALMLGRYQPWHEGHRALFDAASVDSPQVAVGVRSTYATSPKDPLAFDEVSNFIGQDVDSAFIVRMPNITRIVYGRDVGYSIEKIELGEQVEAISATDKRKALGL